MMFALLGIFATAVVGIVAYSSSSEEETIADETSLDEGDAAANENDEYHKTTVVTYPEEVEAEGMGTSGEIDQVYGKHIGDQFGANLFDSLLFQNHAMTGFSGDDTLSGTSEGDLIIGNEGDDVLYGHNDADQLEGNDGDDLIYGGAGGDILHGYEGYDTLYGGDDADLLTGGEGDDTLYGDAGDDKLFGQEGADLLVGGEGDDTLDGTHARNVSEEGVDEDTGDTLQGGAGDDVIVLGNGDIAEGGTGADTFITGEHITEDVPVITDFSVDEDVIEVYYDPSLNENLEITFENTDTGTSVLLNGVPVATLDDVADLDNSSIHLVPIETN